jgi:hypothetical protein
MPDLKSIQSIYLVLGFVVPGMVIAFVRAQFLTGRVRTLSESIVSYIALTVLYYGLAAPFVEYVLTFEEPGRAKIAAWLALIILVPAIVGLILGALTQNDVFRRALQLLRINPVHVTPAAWDYTLARLRGDHFVMVTLSDGSTVGGIYGSHSFASSDPTERDLFLQEIYDVDGGSWSKRSEHQAILIRPKKSNTSKFGTRKELEMSRTNDGYKPTPLPDTTTKGYQPSSVHAPLNPQGGHQPGSGSSPAVPTTGSAVKPPSK